MLPQVTLPPEPEVRQLVRQPPVFPPSGGGFVDASIEGGGVEEVRPGSRGVAQGGSEVAALGAVQPAVQRLQVWNFPAFRKRAVGVEALYRVEIPRRVLG